MTPFTPGELTASQARELNEKLRVWEQFTRLTVAAPLNLSRVAGIPVISAPDISKNSDLLLAEVTAHTGTPPVHTVKRKTRDTSNNVIDLSPAVTYTQVLSPLEEIIPNGTVVAIFPVPEYVDWWWAIPVPGALQSVTVVTAVTCDSTGLHVTTGTLTGRDLTLT